MLYSILVFLTLAFLCAGQTSNQEDLDLCWTKANKTSIATQSTISCTLMCLDSNGKALATVTMKDKMKCNEGLCVNGKCMKVDDYNTCAAGTSNPVNNMVILNVCGMECNGILKARPNSEKRKCGLAGSCSQGNCVHLDRLTDPLSMFGKK